MINFTENVKKSFGIKEDFNKIFKDYIETSEIDYWNVKDDNMIILRKGQNYRYFKLKKDEVKTPIVKSSGKIEVILYQTGNSEIKDQNKVIFIPKDKFHLIRELVKEFELLEGGE
jgi:hypothetical protein